MARSLLIEPTMITRVDILKHRTIRLDSGEVENYRVRAYCSPEQAARVGTEIAWTGLGFEHRHQAEEFAHAFRLGVVVATGNTEVSITESEE